MLNNWRNKILNFKSKINESVIQLISNVSLTVL